MSNKNLGYLVMIGALVLVLGLLKVIDLVSTTNSPPKGSQKDRILQQSKPPPSSSKLIPEPQCRKLSAAELLRDAKEALSRKSKLFPHGNLEQATILLNKINKDNKEYKEAQLLLKKVEKWREVQNRIIDQASKQVIKESRLDYAKRFEKKCLEKGLDVYVQTMGKEAAILKIKWVMMSRPLIYKFINDQKILKTWRDLGFKKVVFTDGYHSNWEIKL